MIQSYRAFRRSFVLPSLAGLTVTLALAVPRIANACTPTGLIQQKWTALEGDLGPCVDNPVSDGAGGTWEQFEWGYVDWIYPETTAYGVWGSIGAAWASFYGGPYVTGQPVTDQEAVPYYNAATPNEAGGFPYQYNEFYNENVHATTFLVWNPYESDIGLECEENPDNVCSVYGSIGVAWWASIGFFDTLAAPIDNAFAVTGGAHQDFVTSWGSSGFATWNSSNNVVCAYGYNGGNLQTLWQVGAGSCLPIGSD